METMPMPLDAQGAAPGGLDEFRVSAPREIAAMLRRLCDGNVALQLHAADADAIDAGAVNATVWSLDAERGSIGFDVDPRDVALQSLSARRAVIVVGYLDNVKIQFEVHHLVLVHGARGSVLTCTFPRELFRFQRRGTYRVRPPQRSDPVARLRHEPIAGKSLTLRVLDVSIGGCALFLPDDVPPMQPGGVLPRVQIDLDAETRFEVNLRLQHVSSLNADACGVRLGCEFVRADAQALRALQRFIDATQKRGRLLTIE